MVPSRSENEQDRIDLANRAEELMLRTRQVARRMQDRLWKAMQAKPLARPHSAPPPAVLVAEDEPIICELLGLMLEGLGFPVWWAADGQEAVDLYLQHRGEIAAAVLDLHMPRLDGPATLRALRGLDPQVGCVFITGHLGDYDEDGLIGPAVEEVLRYDPSVAFMNRVAAEDLEIRGRVIEAGQVVLLGIGAANRDPEVFPDPDSFDVGRAARPHVSFASGAHACLGMGLARLELEVALRSLLGRFPHLRLDPANPPRRRRQTLMFRGFEALPTATS